MNVRNLHLPAALLASLLLAPAALAQPFASPGIVESGDQYADGTRAINEGRWSDAAAIFTKLADERAARADGALYWKAYAEKKQGQSAEALETCARLGRAYSKSRYVRDCDALRIEIQGPRSRTFEIPPVPPIPPIPPVPPVPPVHVEIHGRQGTGNPDEDIKLLALNAVMQQDEARALPIIQQILSGNGSDRLKERALFVLTQSNSSQAQQTLGQVVRGQSNPGLQIKAIRMYAALGGKRSVDTLADVYQHTSDENVKRIILQSYLVTGTPDKLLEAARGEKNPELVKTAVHSLGAMGATNDLQTLYHDSKDQQTKLDIISSLVAAGSKGSEILKSIATSEQDPELRRRAIRNLGVTGGASAAPALLAAYQGSSDFESKKAALDGLFISNSAHELVTLARAEKDPALKQEIVSKLSIMHNKEATEYLLEILNK